MVVSVTSAQHRASSKKVEDWRFGLGCWAVWWVVWLLVGWVVWLLVGLVARRFEHSLTGGLGCWLIWLLVVLVRCWSL